MKKVSIPYIKEESSHSPNIKRLLSECFAEEKKMQNPELIIEKVRNGDAASIEELLLGSRTLIYQIMLRQTESLHSVEKRFNFAHEKLRRLAIKELNSVSRTRFFRFEAWVIRQALIQLEIES